MGKRKTADELNGWKTREEQDRYNEQRRRKRAGLPPLPPLLRKRKYPAPEGMRGCTKCGVIKPSSGFHKCKTGPDGLGCWCRECYGVYQVAYRAKQKKGPTVYALTNPDDGRIKIGYTSETVRSRAYSWRTYTPRVEITGSVSGPVELEGAIHAHLASERVIPRPDCELFYGVKTNKVARLIKENDRAALVELIGYKGE